MPKILPLCYTSACDSCIFRSSCPSNSKVFMKPGMGINNRVFQKGEQVFNQGESFKGLFILRTGSALSSIVSVDGERQVTRFYQPHDVFGFDGFDEGLHCCQVQFLETSSVCHLEPYYIEQMLQESFEVRKGLLKSISHLLVEEYSSRLETTSLNAEQKLCQFLLNMSKKLKGLNLSYNPLHLTMTRGDLANHLGMAIETISRQFKALQSAGAITVRNRHIEIHDFELLEGYCGLPTHKFKYIPYALVEPEHSQQLATGPH